MSARLIVGGQQAQAIGPGWRIRQADYEFLTSPRAAAIVRGEGICVIGYRGIQRAWSRVRGTRDT